MRREFISYNSSNFIFMFGRSSLQARARKADIHRKSSRLIYFARLTAGLESKFIFSGIFVLNLNEA